MPHDPSHLLFMLATFLTYFFHTQYGFASLFYDDYRVIPRLQAAAALAIGIRTDEFESKKRSVGGIGQSYNVTIPGSVELKGEPRHMLVKNAQSSAATEKDPRWASVVARNAQTDGTFYYAVTTTGVYCRPSCPARHATRACAVSCDLRRC